MDPIQTPPPFAGINNKIPKVALEFPFCQSLLNFNLTEEGARLRQGDSVPYTWAVPSGSRMKGLINYTDNQFFGWYFDGATSEMIIRAVQVGVNVNTSAALGEDDYYPLYFNNYLFFFNDNLYAPGIAYNGSTFAAVGYTAASGTFLPKGGNVYKNRAYIIQSGEPAYWYTEIDAISGTVKKVNLATVISEKQNLFAIGSFTQVSANGSRVIQCFVFENGEVLFYDGSYPDSANWGLVGRAQLGTPLSPHLITYQGDSLVIARHGLVSLRDLFLTGSSEGSSLTLSDNIGALWKQYAAFGQYSRGVWDKINERLLVVFPVRFPSLYSSASFPGQTFFVFFSNLKAWTVHFNGEIFLPAPPGTANLNNGLIYSNNSVYSSSFYPATGSNNFSIIKKESNTVGSDPTYTDDSWNDGTTQVPYPYEIISAPLKTGRAYIQKVEAVDVLIESDLYDETQYTLIADFGVMESDAQYIPNPGTGTFQKPQANIGIEGSYVQYKISGATVEDKTIGYVFYGANIWETIGESPR